MSSWRKVYGETKKDKRSFSTWLASLLRPKSFDDELWNEFRNAKTDDEIRDVMAKCTKKQCLDITIRAEILKIVLLLCVVGCIVAVAMFLVQSWPMLLSCLAIAAFVGFVLMHHYLKKVTG